MSRFVRVLLDQSAGKQLDYGLPAALAGRVQVGSRVRVPVRTRLVMATVTEVLDHSDVPGVKDITEVVGDSPMVGPVLMQLAQWMADYYCCGDEAATRSVLPVVIRKGKVKHKTRQFVQLTPDGLKADLEALGKRAPKQAEVIRLLRDQEASVEVASLGGLRQAVGALTKAGLVEVTDERVARDPEGTFLASPELAMNPEQENALNAAVLAIDQPDLSRPILLHGVTGSGKTEVYLRAMRHAIHAGQSAIVLVPEISLTPQTVERFKSRFAEMQDQVAVMHSHLSEGERHDEWHKVYAGGARIVIGARSAVFAPLKNLGLIVVDEEHESSYKQDEAPRYHGRDLAVLRASLEPCAVILGSATPSMESYRNVVSGKYELVEMLTRIDNRRLPLIRVVDMRHQNRRGGQDPVLSPILCAGIEERLKNGQQTILFLNRRGYASAMLCNVCGHVCHCPNCSVALTYHRGEERLRCHICGHNEVAHTKCPGCKDPGIRHAGAGTQKIEEAVRRVFAKARVERMDADTMARRGGYRETLGRFKTGEIDILVGTQMIAKGLHFPNVTLVGIINADIGLHVADFRAGERTFQLLTQVAGRAGRGDFEGEVLIQTYTPSSPSIQFARHHDFAGFWDQESELREKFRFPPYARLALITVRGPDEDKTAFCAQTLERRIREVAEPDWLVGEAAAAPLARAKGEFRYHITIRANRIVRVSRCLKQILASFKHPSKIRITVDIDAHHLL